MSRRSDSPDAFVQGVPISFTSKSTGKITSIDADTVVEVVAHTNEYLFSLAAFFVDVDFDFYGAIGQRNLSGFIGEVFANAFAKVVPDFAVNPHADGRPDLIDLTTEESQVFFSEECFAQGGDRKVPIRKRLAPYRYGGLEVKATIGSPIPVDKRAEIFESLGAEVFYVGLPRIDFLSTITYWGHHASCENLLGLYYDYVPEMSDSPQVLLVMHSELDPETDWNKVSIGKSSSKKTSNTSLTAAGKSRMFNRVVCVTKAGRYLTKLAERGLSLPHDLHID